MSLLKHEYVSNIREGGRGSAKEKRRGMVVGECMVERGIGDNTIVYYSSLSARPL